MKRDLLLGGLQGLLGSLLAIAGGIAWMTVQAERHMLGCVEDDEPSAGPDVLHSFGES